MKDWKIKLNLRWLEKHEKQLITEGWKADTLEFPYQNIPEETE